MEINRTVGSHPMEKGIQTAAAMDELAKFVFGRLSPDAHISFWIL
jgi:hypothetical protein